MMINTMLTLILKHNACLAFKFAMLSCTCIFIGFPLSLKICLSSTPAALHASTNVWGTKYRFGLSWVAQHVLSRMSSWLPGSTRIKPSRGTLDSTRPPSPYTAAFVRCFSAGKHSRRNQTSGGYLDGFMEVVECLSLHRQVLLNEELDRHAIFRLEKERGLSGSTVS
jgi:hypothetical protein